MTITISTQLETHTCAVCGMLFAAPEHWVKSKCRELGGSLYCPAGHSLGFGTSENAKLKEQLAKEKSARDQAQAKAAEEERLRIAAEKSLKHTKVRLKGGKCPCCNRNFVSLARHLATKHPDYVKP